VSSESRPEQQRHPDHAGRDQASVDFSGPIASGNRVATSRANSTGLQRVAATPPDQQQVAADQGATKAVSGARRQPCGLRDARAEQDRG
jgi:hypothetical protein